MRSKTVIRYYCDHCSKGGFRKPDMMQHELTCTLNPKRCCYLCEFQTGTERTAKIIAEFKQRTDVEELEYPTAKATHQTESADAIKWLMEQTAQCPACALSLLRQGKIMAFQVFDYKVLKAEWLRDENHAWMPTWT